MADKMIFHKIGLISGAAGFLDSISGANRGDGNPLQADDAAFTMASNVLYAHLFDAASTAVESSPDIIRPDDIAAIDPGRWILQSVNPTAAQIAAIITGATNETTPLDADDFGFYKATVAALRKVTWANIKATLKAYFDGIYATGTIPTKAAYTDINTGTDDAKFLTSLALTESKPTIHGATITAIRGTELAPAITEANWDTRNWGTGFIDPIVGGVLDKGAASGSTAMPNSMTIEEGSFYEVTFTAINSPTTGTFVAGGSISDDDLWEYPIPAIGTYTFILKSPSVNSVGTFGTDASRFGISAISIKKLTEGNLTMDGGQIKAEANLKGDIPAYSFNGHELLGIAPYFDGDAEGLDFFGKDSAGDPMWLGSFDQGAIWTIDPTGGTAAGWKLGSVVNDTIEVEVGGDTVLRYILTEAVYPVASSNATAATAGVRVGGLYRTNADPSVICVRSA